MINYVYCTYAYYTYYKLFIKLWNVMHEYVVEGWLLNVISVILVDYEQEQMEWLVKSSRLSKE